MIGNSIAGPGEPERVTELVALIGPSAVGKTTHTIALTARRPATVFPATRVRPRPARPPRRRPGLVRHLRSAGLAAGADRHPALLRGAFLHRQFPAAGLVVTENFPGTVAQLHLLAHIAHAMNVPLSVVELDAPDAQLRARAQCRRVCATCEPDPAGDPHRPAAAASHDATPLRAVRRHADVSGERQRGGVLVAAQAFPGHYRRDSRRRVAIPRKGKTGPARQHHERRPSFRRLVKWRTGCEGRISHLKHRYGGTAPVSMASPGCGSGPDTVSWPTTWSSSPPWRQPPGREPVHPPSHDRATAG